MAGIAKIKIEMEVSKRLTKLLEEATEIHALCSANGLALPESLARLLGETSASDQTASSKMLIPPMLPPEEPPDGASPSWIWVHESAAIISSLVRAWLNQAPGPLSPTQIFLELARRKQDVSKGSIANLGTRFEEDGTISRSAEGWVLLRRDRAPVLHREHLWGEPGLFDKSEVASYRRSAVKHILQSMPDGLQMMQLTNVLKENCPWFNSDIPVSKDLIKMDMRELEKDGEARRKGASGKWELTE